MGFSDSYLGKLRARIGSDLVLVPGASVLVTDESEQILLLHRTDDGSWCIPGGAAEIGSSFLSTAQAELHEETGIAANAADLVPYASISEAEHHTLTYPNGDVSHCFALCFALIGWSGDKADLVTDDESVDLQFFARDSLPTPMAPVSLMALDLYDLYVSTGMFQLR